MKKLPFILLFPVYLIVVAMTTIGMIVFAFVGVVGWCYETALGLMGADIDDNEEYFV